MTPGTPFMGQSAALQDDNSHVLDVNVSGDLSVHRRIYRDLAPAVPLQVPVAAK